MDSEGGVPFDEWERRQAGDSGAAVSSGAVGKAETPPAGRLVVQRASDVTPKRVAWLWPGRLPVGKLVVIAGDPGLGKSQLALLIAATVSTGGRWPVDGTKAPLGSTLILSAEDDAADTIVPRLKAAGADLGKIVTSAGLVATNDAPAGLTLDKHVAAIEGALIALGDARLLILDPPAAFLGRTDSHNNAEVRGLLAPLADLAARLGVTVLLVNHLNKAGQGPAVHRATGSIAFVAAARAAFLVCKDQEDPERRLFLPTKNNLGPDRGGLAFRVHANDDGVPYLAFEPNPVFVTADDALNPARDPKPRDEAKDWLAAYLADGPRRQGAIKEDAEALGHAWATVRRAAKELGVESFKQKGATEGGWLWRLPNAPRDRDADDNQPPRAEDAQDAQDAHAETGEQVEQVEQVEHLRRCSLSEDAHQICLRETFPLDDATQPKGDDAGMIEEIIL